MTDTNMSSLGLDPFPISTAGSYIQEGKLAEAEPLLAEALKGHRARGQDDVELLLSLNNLGLEYHKRGESSRAEPLFAQALDGFRRAKGENDPNTLTMMTNLGLAYLNQNKPAEAEPLFQRKLGIQRRTLDTSSLKFREALRLLTKCQLRQKKYADAEKYLRELVANNEQNVPDLWFAFEARSLLGESLLGQKKYYEAEPLLVDGYKGLEARAGQISEEEQDCLTEAGDRLVRLYEQWGRPEEAARWRVRLKKSLPEDGTSQGTRPECSETGER